jgi:ABC-2 type transport system permease protein
MRTLSLTKRLIKQIVRDRRTVALLFIAPLFILWLLSLVFTANDTKTTFDVIGAPAVVLDKLRETGATVAEVSLEAGKERLAAGETDAYLEFALPKVNVVLEGSDPLANRAVMQTVQMAMQALVPTNGVVKQFLDVTYLHGGSTLTMLDYFAPVLIGFFILFFVFLISGVSFLRERTGGTLERMMATPIRRHEIVFGYFFGFGLFAVLQTTWVQWFTLQVLDVNSVGSFGSVLVVNILIATVALSLGTLLSAFARNELQMVQFIPLVILPQIFLSGLFDLRGMPDWVIWLSKAMPLTHGAEALRGIMIRGDSLADIWMPLVILSGYSLFFLALNIAALRKYRKV